MTERIETLHVERHDGLYRVLRDTERGSEEWVVSHCLSPESAVESAAKELGWGCPSEDKVLCETCGKLSLITNTETVTIDQERPKRQDYICSGCIDSASVSE